MKICLAMHMKIILTVFVLLIFSTIHAQSCKFNYKKIDPSSGNQIMRVDFKISPNHHVSYYKNGDSYFISQTISFRGDLNDTIKVGAQLKLRLHNNTSISLASKNNAEPEFQMFSDSERTRYVLLYPCTADEFQLIAEHGFTIFSYIFDQREDFAQLKKKSAQRTAFAASCILEN